MQMAVHNDLFQETASCVEKQKQGIEKMLSV